MLVEVYSGQLAFILANLSSEMLCRIDYEVQSKTPALGLQKRAFI